MRATHEQQARAATLSYLRGFAAASRLHQKQPAFTGAVTERMLRN